MAQQHNLLDGTKARRLGRMGLAILLAAAASSGLLRAQTPWRATAQTAVPTFMNLTGVSNSQTVQTQYGTAVRIRPGVIGVTTLHIPVTAPPGSKFSRMSLMAADDTPAGLVRATLFRRLDSQEQESVEFLGSVVTSGSSGIQRRTADLSKSVELAAGDCYFIRLDLIRSQADAAVLALEVELE